MIGGCCYNTGMRLAFCRIALGAFASLLCGVATAMPKPVVWMGWAHEPDDFMRRRGGRGNSATYGEWTNAGYDRIHSEEVVRKAADLGVNLIYCHFFKGFGLDYERANMERTKGLVELAHRHGIEVLGYCTFGTLMEEVFRDEVPELDDWVSHDPSGGVIHYYGQPFRPIPCRSNPDYLNYLKRVVTYGVEHVGLDGFHFDNGLIWNCHCARCQQSFRDYLTEHVRDPRAVCGLPHFRHVRIPAETMFRSPDVDRDPISLVRNRWRQEANDRAIGEVFDHVRRVGGRYVVYNAAIGAPGARDSGCYSPANAKTDFQFIENGRSTRRREGIDDNQVLTYKTARCFGYRLFDGTSMFPKGAPQEGRGLRDSMNRSFAQEMAFGRLVGCSWPISYARRGDRLRIDDPDACATMKRAFGYYLAHQALYEGTPLNRAKLLFSITAFVAGKGNDSPSYLDFQALAERLHRSAVPYDVIDENGVGSVRAGETIVLCRMPHATRALYEALAAAANRGVRIVRTGDWGLYDEYGLAREETNPACNLAGLGGVLTALPEDLGLSVCDADGTRRTDVFVETARTEDGARILHLFRVDNERALDKVVVRWDEPSLQGLSAPELFSFEDGVRLGACSVRGGSATLTVENLKTLATLRFGKEIP